MTTAAITLPHGLLDGGRRRVAAELRLPTGTDEAELFSTPYRSRAEQVTTLLARCVVRVGEDVVDDDVARALTVGDREALLLHLRARLFGDRLACVVDCPECGERMDVDLLVSELLLPPYEKVRERYAVETANGEIDVRLVTGADQEAAARHADTEAGVEELLARCASAAVAADREAVSDVLVDLDPQAEIMIDAVCPACDQPVVALLDAAGVLLAELTGSDDRLLREVDAIARAYHWSEAEILGLDVQRRRRYLVLLSEDAEGQ